VRVCRQLRAGGTYKQGTGTHHAFVVNEVNGTWQAVIEVPGTSALDVGQNAFVSAASCATAGRSRAGGSYRDGARHDQVFVVSEMQGPNDHGGAAEQHDCPCGACGTTPAPVAVANVAGRCAHIIHSGAERSATANGHPLIQIEP